MRHFDALITTQKNLIPQKSTITKRKQENQKKYPFFCGFCVVSVHQNASFKLSTDPLKKHIFCLNKITSKTPGDSIYFKGIEEFKNYFPPYIAVWVPFDLGGSKVTQHGKQGKKNSNFFF